MQIKDIIRTCNAKLLIGDENTECESFSKDTRTIKEGDTYIGIKGEKFDGNTMYEKAFENGAKVCILQKVQIPAEVLEKYKENKAIIIVEDTIKALQDIARYKRSLYKIPVVAVTGSVGKTSTKDIIASVVSTKFKTLKTQGNLNNHIGLPLTILGLRDEEALVVEMGMNNLGEISVLSNIAKPNIAIITNVGTSHIGNLGSRENILKAKLEILEGLEEGGTLIINNDNDLLNAWNKKDSKNINVITFGIDELSNIMAKDVILNENSSQFKVVINNKEMPTLISVPVGGKHFVYNALTAIAVGTKLGIALEDIQKGIQNFELTKSRMECISMQNGVTVVNDCYNANFDSMKAGIEYLANANATRRIAVLGDMLELGEFSEELHRKVGEELAKNKIDIVITVGNLAKIIADTASTQGIFAKKMDNNSEASKYIKENMKKGDLILVKASNGMKFTEIVNEVCKG